MLLTGEICPLNLSNLFLYKLDYRCLFIFSNLQEAARGADILYNHESQKAIIKKTKKIRVTVSFSSFILIDTSLISHRSTLHLHLLNTFFMWLNCHTGLVIALNNPKIYFFINIFFTLPSQKTVSFKSCSLPWCNESLHHEDLEMDDKNTFIFCTVLK